MPQVSTAPVGSVGMSSAKTLRANAIRIMRTRGVVGRRRRRK